MATVIYNSCAIIPSPIVSFTDEPILAGNQHRIGNTYRMSINGTLVNYKGSPASSGMSGAGWGGYNNQFWQTTGYPPDESNPSFSYHQLAMIENKQQALRTLFATEGQWLEFQSLDGSPPIKAQIKNVQINFEEGIWFTECKYTINCEADVLYLNGEIYQGLPFSDLIQQASENWEITPDQQIAKNFNVSHTVSAVGKRGFDDLGNESNPAWIAAKNFANDQLVLGWNGISNYSPLSGNYMFNTSYASSGVLNFANYNPYNYSVVETIDELAGSYQVVERWDLSASPSGSNVYTINTRRIVDDPYCTVVTQIQGTIHGQYNGLFNYDQRIQGAEYYWNSTLAGPTGLLTLINDIYSGYTYNIQPRQGSIDYNKNEGTLIYNYEFSNQLYEGDAFEQWTTSRHTSSDSYITTFGINGTIKGRRYDGDLSVTGSFQRAYVWFSALSGNNYNTLYNRILSSKYWPEASGLGLQPDPVSKIIDLNEAEGLITYALEYNNRSNDGGYPSDMATEEYQISKHFSRDDGITRYTINGTVKGLNVTDTSNPRQTKFANASGFFYNYVLPNLYNRIVTYYNVSLPDSGAITTEIGTFPVAGEMTYSYEYWNLFPPLLSGALSEHISVGETNYNQQVRRTALIDIPGRSSGPVIQDVSTTVVKVRTINIEAVLSPTGDLASIANAYATKPFYDNYVYQLQPPNSYCSNWTDNYDWRFGRYNLSAEFLYE